MCQDTLKVRESKERKDNSQAVQGDQKGMGRLGGKRVQDGEHVIFFLKIKFKKKKKKTVIMIITICQALIMYQAPHKYSNALYHFIIT